MPSINFIQDLAVVVLVAGVVGWICQRLHLSVVVGYLVAGMVVGPYTPPFSLVHDSGRIATLAQVGLIFLIFSIGLRLSLRKLRRLGLALLIATLIGAVIVFNLSRLVGTMLGFSLTESFFLASMLMVSSSAVISKVLAEAGVTHEKVGQLATGLTVLEDVVAVVMLTLLSSFVQVGRPGAARLGETLGLLGAIVAETPHRTQVDRVFEGLRDVFSAVFFVAIGMQIDIGLLRGTIWLILGVAVLAVAGRTVACALGLVATGTDPKEALRVGM